MIRRALKSVLPAAAAVLALLPVTAGAAAASTVAAHPVAAVAAPHHARTHHYLNGRVATRHGRLNVRSGPGTRYRVVGHRDARRLISVSCKSEGSRVHGNRLWYRLPNHRGYVSAHYVRTGRYVPWC